MKLWPPWKNRIKLGDLVRFNDAKRAKVQAWVSEGKTNWSVYAREHLQHIFEIGLVIDTDGLDPVVSFPSFTMNAATENLEVC